MRTNGRFLMDTSLPDGVLFYSPSDLISAATDAEIVRVSKGLIKLVAPAATTTILPIAINPLYRYGMADDAQNQFGMGTPSGGFQGAQGQATTTLTPFTSPYGPNGRPPYTAVSAFTPTTKRPKGVAINSIMPIYQVNAVDLTSISLGLSQTTFSSGSAPVVTDIIAPGTNGLSVSHLVPGTIATAVPVAVQNNMLINPLAEYICELQFVAPAGSTVDFYGIFVNVSFNYN